MLKIRSVLPRDRQDYLERLDRTTVVIARGANGNPSASNEALIPVQRALAERRVLTIEYQGKQSSELTRRDVEPLGLVYYADHWHLIAFCRLRHEVRDFRTDRISHFQLKNETFPPHDSFSIKDYLASCKENKFQMAYLRFDRSSIDRVHRESECGIIDERPEGDSIVVTFVTCSFDWLTGWILSFGKSAEVLAPKELRDRVAGEAETILRHYVSGDPTDELLATTAGPCFV